MSGEIGVNHGDYAAAQSALDSSRGKFAGQATMKVTSLTSAQTAGKWGEESGPVAARQQYTTTLQDIQQAITTLNANFIAFLTAASKTQELMRNTEQNNIDLTQHMTEEQLAAYDAALAQAEKETRGAQAVQKTGQALQQGAKALAGLPNGLADSWFTKPAPQQLGPVAADDASSSTPQLPPTFLGGLGMGDTTPFSSDLVEQLKNAPTKPSSGLPNWNSPYGYGRD